MKRIRTLAIGLCLGLSLNILAFAEGEKLEAEPAPAPAKSTLEVGISRIAALQSMVEFFFMEAGVYPAELSELSAVYNYQLPRGATALVVPMDPATGQAFVYQVSANKKDYRLRFPDPSKYGVGGQLELKAIDWGWLALRAERMRFEEMAKLSKYHMETLATQIEMFAKDNKGKFPATLDELFPKYISRHPQDPITGKNYIYKPLGDSYLVGNPNPERYGLKLFQYSSTRGMEVEAIPSGAASSAVSKPSTP